MQNLLDTTEEKNYFFTFRNAIHELSIGCGLDDDQRNQRDELLNCLDRACISPYNYFVINNASLLSMFASVITYLIVLLQFRASG